LASIGIPFIETQVTKEDTCWHEDNTNGFQVGFGSTVMAML
jgi:hypothetical protein